jgi:hypothetical protein
MFILSKAQLADTGIISKKLATWRAKEDEAMLWLGANRRGKFT